MFPVVDSNLDPDALVQRVLVHYRLGEPITCRLHARGLNDTYKVEAAGTAYFLRVYRAGWRSREEIDTELAMLRHLADCGVSVSAPLARRDGEMLTMLDCAEGERLAALFTAAPGREVDYKAFTEEQACAYGEAAASIHGAADSYSGPRSRPPLDLAQLGLIEAVAEPEIGFCHGDFHGQNASESGGVFTFYDFDCCGWGFRAYDLAVFPWAFAVGESPPERIESMGRAFLRGYRRRRPIAAGDLAAIPAFAAIRQIWLMGLHLGLAGRFGAGWINDRYFDRHLKILRNWEENFLCRPATACLNA
jgi:Ser/Thr protein kinase RdoA (MazF antagonist)